MQSPGFLGIGRKSNINLKRSPGKADYFTEDLGNGITLEMVSIPGGKFIMGAPENEPGSLVSEYPQHQVTIKPFFMGKFPVTQAQWQAVSALPKIDYELKLKPSHFRGDNLPVERVSWNDAREFCARLSKKTGKEYQLPSEAQWEYACRAGTTTPFHFGDTITTDLANYNGNRTYGAAPKGEYRQQTTSVGSFPPNAFGLYDMHGNVWEWCGDHWHGDHWYGNYQGAPINGSAWIDKGADNNSKLQRVIRGGSWSIYPRTCRSASRNYDDAVIRSLTYIGFRVVCAVPSTS